MSFWHDLFSVIRWLHGLIYTHDVMNDTVMNTATYNSCLFDMNCMLLFISWRWLTLDDDVVNGEYYHLTTHVILTWIVLLWLHWLIHLHAIMNYIVVNIIRYNSCYSDVNCIFVDVMNCWRLPSYNSSLFNTNCMVWYESVLCCFVICLCCHEFCL